MVKSPEAIENDYLKKELERVTKEYLKFASTWQTENDRLKLEAKEKTTALEDLHQKMQAMSLELAKVLIENNALRIENAQLLEDVVVEEAMEEEEQYEDGEEGEGYEDEEEEEKEDNEQGQYMEDEQVDGAQDEEEEEVPYDPSMRYDYGDVYQYDREKKREVQDEEYVEAEYEEEEGEVDVVN
ncbi:hypothetical protein L3Y34_019303 [Caenorhabditis briggsae]|uniref:Uncharacterized protein n=1 Tax=Caenorhabditis briggsae TaxID=6238 RepID=A0AAE9DPM0_CAEBR|nr:hypothetical protein L3Y34_019303 [Caenorhabditis briggsae]